MDMEQVIAQSAQDLMDNPDVLDKDPDWIIAWMLATELKDLIRFVFKYELAMRKLNNGTIDFRLWEQFTEMSQARARAAQFLLVLGEGWVVPSPGGEVPAEEEPVGISEGGSARESARRKHEN